MTLKEFSLSASYACAIHELVQRRGINRKLFENLTSYSMTFWEQTDTVWQMLWSNWPSIRLGAKTSYWFEILIRWIPSLVNARHNNDIRTSKNWKKIKKVTKSLSSISINLMVYEVSYLMSRSVETSFILIWSSRKADLRQNNPSLKHVW